MKHRIFNKNLLHPDLSYDITGCCFAAQNRLGRYAREKQYADALEELFGQEKIKYQREWPIGDTGNRADFFIEDKIVLELKAKGLLEKRDYYQVQRYLQHGGIELGLLVNFRNRYIKPSRILRLAPKKFQHS